MLYINIKFKKKYLTTPLRTRKEKFNLHNWFITIKFQIPIIPGESQNHHNAATNAPRLAKHGRSDKREDSWLEAFNILRQEHQKSFSISSVKLVICLCRTILRYVDEQSWTDIR